MSLVPANQLIPGMVLRENLVSKGLFSLDKGTVLTEPLIQKVKNFMIDEAHVHTNPRIINLGNKALKTSSLSLTQKVYPKGEFLFLQGDQAGEIFLLLEGELEVLYAREEKVLDAETREKRKSIIRTTGRKVTILQRKNSVFGEMGPLLRLNRTASIRTRSDSLVAVIPAGENLVHAMLENPDLGMSMAIGLATRMEDIIQTIQKYNNIVNQLEPIAHEFPLLYTATAEKLKAKVISTKNPDIELLHEDIKKSSLYLRTSRFQKENDVFKEVIPPFLKVRQECDPRVFKDVQIQSAERGEVISSDGSIADRIHILYSGSIGIFKGEKKLFEYQRVGDALGTVRAILGFAHAEQKFENRNLKLKATRPSQFIEIDALELGQMAKRNPALILHLCRGLAERLAYTNEELLDSLWKIEHYIRKLTRSKDSILNEIQIVIDRCMNHSEAVKLCLAEIRALYTMRETLVKLETNFDRMMTQSRSNSI